MSTHPLDTFGWREWSEQTNLAKVKPGDYLYTTTTPAEATDGRRIVQLERPQYAAGIARKVIEAVKVQGGRCLTFEDGTTIVPRNGTAAAYRFLLTSAGQPLPVPLYPVCPTCKAGEDDPACHPNGNVDQWTSTHKARLKAPLPKPKAVSTLRIGQPEAEVEGRKITLHGENTRDLVPGDRVYTGTSKVDGCAYPVPSAKLFDKDTVVRTVVENVKDVASEAHIVHFDDDTHAVEAAGINWWLDKQRHDTREPARPASLEDGLGVQLLDGKPDGGALKRVHKDPDGTVYIEGWTGGDGEHVTPEGWRVHVSAEGIVTVLDADKQQTTISKGHTPVPAELVRKDDDPLPDPVDDEVGADNVVPCHGCKGFGVVRAKGERKGQRYRTYKGALAAKANGNTAECPTCKGDGYLVDAA